MIGEIVLGNIGQILLQLHTILYMVINTQHEHYLDGDESIQVFFGVINHAVFSKNNELLHEIFLIPERLASNLQYRHQSVFHEQ